MSENWTYLSALDDKLRELEKKYSYSDAPGWCVDMSENWNYIITFGSKVREAMTRYSIAYERNMADPRAEEKRYIVFDLNQLDIVLQEEAEKLAKLSKQERCTELLKLVDETMKRSQNDIKGHIINIILECDIKSLNQLDQL